MREVRANKKWWSNSLLSEFVVWRLRVYAHHENSFTHKTCEVVPDLVVFEGWYNDDCVSAGDFQRLELFKLKYGSVNTFSREAPCDVDVSVPL